MGGTIAQLPVGAQVSLSGHSHYRTLRKSQCPLAGPQFGL
jgi:hypothetical protein